MEKRIHTETERTKDRGLSPAADAILTLALALLAWTFWAGLVFLIGWR